MNSSSLSDIKFDLKRTRRAIVAAGCSFVQGAELDLDYDEKDRLSGRIKNQRSFVNLLCKKYFENYYTPINFGQESGGNFAAISRLFLYDIPWKDLEEIVLIFMPTGMQRFDVIRDDVRSQVNSDFKSLWPYLSTPDHNDQDWRNFNKGYEQTAYSERFEVLNAILNFQFLNSWVHQFKPKLLIFPAFSKEYNKDYFLQQLQTGVIREPYTEKFLKTTSNTLSSNTYNNNFLVNSVPWDKFITVDGSINFFDLCYKNDKNYRRGDVMYEVMNNSLMYNNDWIMPRGHPSAKGHDLLAEQLFKLLSKS